MTGAPYSTDQCRNCWLQVHADPVYGDRYKLLFGGVTPTPRPAAARPKPEVVKDCPARGARVATERCGTCPGAVGIKVYSCSNHPEGCTAGRRVPGRHLCDGGKGVGPVKTVRWSYGVTTVPSRRADLLPRTLRSLGAAGFPQPHIFVDDCARPPDYNEFLPTGLTTRHPKVRVAKHWALSLAELYVRDPAADRYALFQDDVLLYPDLRAYLDRCVYPAAGYWNLYTVPVNEALANGRLGWYESNQMGKGALALVFDRATLIKLLTSEHFVTRPQDVNRGHRSIDGGVVTALGKAGVREYVHHPTLVQHTGDVSSMGNSSKRKPGSWRGEGFSALDLLPARGIIGSRVGG